MNIQSTAAFAQIVACLGIIPAGIGIYNSMEEARSLEEKTNKAIRLAALSHINEMIREDEEAQLAADVVLDRIKSLPDHEALLAQYGSGQRIYRGIEGLSRVGRHYEHLGAMIRLEYLDFDMVFEVIAFPDEFWDESSELMAFIRQNWGGKDQPLPDLWSNFADLRERYHQKRAEVAKAAAQHASS